MDNLSNAADMIYEQLKTYPPETVDKIRQLYASGDLQGVLDVAAEHDIKQRESLSKEIYTIPNPDYLPIEEIAELLAKQFSEEMSAEEAILALNSIRRGGTAPTITAEQMKKMLELDDEQPRVFKIKGDDRIFKTAADAGRAIKDSRGILPANEKDHRLTSNPILEGEGATSE